MQKVEIRKEGFSVILLFKYFKKVKSTTIEQNVMNNTFFKTLFSLQRFHNFCASSQETTSLT